MIMRKAIFIIALAVIAAACNNTANQRTSGENEATGNKTETGPSYSELYEKEWKLSELNGKAIVLDSTFQQYPHLVFHKENTVSGSLGCNRFGGEITFEAGNMIKISKIVATQMACPNLQVEQGFLDALNNAKSYKLENNVLTLSNDKKEVTAKLEASAK